MLERRIKPPSVDSVTDWGRENAEHFALIDYSIDYWVALHDPLFNAEQWVDRDKVLPEWRVIRHPIPSSDKAEALASDGVT